MNGKPPYDRFWKIDWTIRREDGSEHAYSEHHTLQEDAYDIARYRARSNACIACDVYEVSDWQDPRKQWRFSSIKERRYA